MLTEIYADGRPCHIYEATLSCKKYTALDSTYLCGLVDQAPPGGDVSRLIDSLHRSFILQQAMSAALRAQDIIEQATEETAHDAVAQAQDAIMSVDVEVDTDTHPADAAVEQITEWQTVDMSNRVGLHWFIQDIDSLVGPLTDELVFINSLPSVGKTAFSLNLMVYAASHNVRASFVSLESARNKIAQRLTTIVSGVNANQLKFQRTTPERYEEARNAMRSFKSMPSGWTFKARTLGQIYAWARMEKKKGSKAVIIDNMKHIQTHQTLHSTAEQFRDLSLRVKQMRDRLQMPVIMLHHLTDEMKVSWSRDIERDADIICNLENMDNSLAADHRRVAFVCCKNRDGKTGEVELVFDKPRQRFDAQANSKERSTK
jgi:replicative DNA helicase